MEPDKITLSVAPEPGIAGLDELAGDLGVKPSGGPYSLVIEGRSGKTYGLIELMQAHIKLMRSTT